MSGVQPTFVASDVVVCHGVRLQPRLQDVCRNASCALESLYFDFHTARRPNSQLYSFEPGHRVEESLPNTSMTAVRADQHSLKLELPVHSGHRLQSTGDVFAFTLRASNAYALNREHLGDGL